MTSTLSKVPISAWVLSTAEAMGALHATDRSAWAKCWADSYRALGGMSDSVAHKGCPRSAAHALWYLGWLKDSERQYMDWTIRHVADRLGKNAAYAVIAARLLRCEQCAASHSALWQRVRQEFERETGARAAKSDQGAVKVALLLSLDRMLVAHGPSSA